jgi:predicted membrane channel-forming protein YqfA (hemolysin III family)
MSIIPAIGSTSLGIVIGWLVRYFIRRFTTFTPMVFGSLVSIILGGAALKFLDADKTVWWFYPIGLLLGFIIYHVGSILYDRSPPGPKSSGAFKLPKFSDKSNPYRIK